MAVDQQVSEVMGEVQRLEAKHANLDHMMGRIEDDVKKLKLEKVREKHSLATAVIVGIHGW